MLMVRILLYALLIEAGVGLVATGWLLLYFHKGGLNDICWMIVWASAIAFARFQLKWQSR